MKKLVHRITTLGIIIASLVIMVTPVHADYIGGITVSFIPSEQQITETSATLQATISSQIEMPVQFQVLVGSSPSQITQTLMPTLTPASVNQGLVPGEIKKLSIPFTGLVKNTTYYFIVKNNATGTQSPVWNFTTQGGTGAPLTSPTTIIDTSTNPYAQPDTLQQPVSDTISDKGIVPKCGRTQNDAGTIPDNELRMCTADDFFLLVANVIQYALIIFGPILAMVVMFAGAMILWLNWSSDPTEEIKTQIKKYWGILVNAGIGVFIIVIAWVLVATLIKELGVKPEFVLLDLFN